MKITTPCLRLPDELDALLTAFVSKSEERLRQTIKTAPKAGQSGDELAETLNFNWSAFASKQFPKEVQAKKIPSLFINAPKTTTKPSGTTVYAFRHPTKVNEFQKYQAETREQWRAFFREQGVDVDEEAFFRLSGIEGLKPMSGTLTATSAPEQALLSIVEEISGWIANAPKGAEMTALPIFSTDPATDMLLSKYVAEIYGNFVSYLRGRYGDDKLEGVNAIISFLEQARAEYLNRTLSHLTGIQPRRQPVANPSQITVAQVKDFLATQKGLPRGEAEALAGELSKYFGEEQGLSSPDVSFLQVYLLDAINYPPNSMRGIGDAEGLNHIRSAVYRAWRIPQSVPNRREKVSAIIEDLFNKRIPADTPEPLRRWLQQHGWQEAKESAPRVESRVEEPKPAPKPEPQPEPAPAPTPPPAEPTLTTPPPADRTLPALPSVVDWDSGAIRVRFKQLESVYASQLEDIQLTPSARKQRESIRNFAQKAQEIANSPKEFHRNITSLIGKLLNEANNDELGKLSDGGVFAQLLTDLREALIEAQQAFLIHKRKSDEAISIIDYFLHQLPEKSLDPATVLPVVDEPIRANRPKKTAIGARTFPSVDEWTREEAENSVSGFLRAIFQKVPTSSNVAYILRFFVLEDIPATATQHFRELLPSLRRAKDALSGYVYDLFLKEIDELPADVRESLAEWFLSVRRFAEGVAGKDGITQAEVGEVVSFLDDLISMVRGAEPISTPATTSAIDEAIEQIAEPAPTPAPEPAPTVRAEEPAPTAEPAEAVAPPERGRRGRRKKPEPEPTPVAEEPAPTAEPPSPPTAPPPTEPAPTAPTPSEPAPPAPPTPPTPPPTAGGAPIELPQQIEFEEFPITLRAVMQEYGLPSVREAKPEYGKMEQLIAHYFGTNGALSSIQDAVLMALDEIVSSNTVNAHRGIEKSRFFTIQDGRVVLRNDFNEQLEISIAGLRQSEPILHFLSNDLLAGFLVLEDALKVLAVSAGDKASEALPFIHHFLAFRLLNPERVQNLPDIISALAGGMNAQTAKEAVEGIETFLKQRVGEQWFAEVEDRLREISATGIISRLITAYFNKAPVLYYGDSGRLTEAEWSSWGTFAKRQFVKTLLTDEQAWATFRANFANPIEIDRMKQGILSTAVVRHPYILHALLTYAQETGFNLPALVASADVFRRHIDAVRDIFFQSGIPPSTLASIDDFGVNGYRAWLTELRTALRTQGADDADRALEQALEAVKGREDDLLGFEVLKTILGFSNDLDGLPALKQVMNNLANVMFALHGFYKKAVVANIGEELLPVLRAFQDEGLIGEVIVPEPNAFSGRSLRKALKEEYGAIDADTAFRHLVDGLPPSVRSIYYTAQTAGREADFDLFIPSFVADLIAQPDFLRTRQVWDTLNNIFKSSVIVYNPPAVIRNAFTNTMLMWYIGGGNIFRKAVRQVQPYGEIPRPLEVGLAEAFQLQREAVREIKSGTKLARDLEAIDPSISLLRTYERLPEWEVINSTDSRAVRGFRWVSNRALLRNAHYFQTLSETAAKYASVKELLRRWGKLDNYTVDDLIKAVAETNAWLINYRVVPPAVQFMRKYLGLFPFITFQLNTLVNFARHPERFYTDFIRGGVYLERLHNIFYFLANDPLTTQHDIRGEQKNLYRLFPEYMRHNPLLVAVPDDRGDVWAMDLTYWLPIGVFETQYDPHPIFGEMPIPLPQLATIGWLTDYKDLVRYFGGAIRPFAEAILNKNLLTGQPIYDENLPELEKARAIGGFLVGQVPFIRWLLGMGFGAREVNPIGRTRSADTLFQRGVALMGIRAYHMPALQEARIKELQAKMNELNRTLSSLTNNPTLSPERKVQLARMYEEKRFELQQQLEEQLMVWVPLVVRLDGKTPIYINTPTDFGAIMGALQAKRRLDTREAFFNEAYPPYVPPTLPSFEEEVMAGMMAEMMEEEEE